MQTISGRLGASGPPQLTSTPSVYVFPNEGSEDELVRSANHKRRKERLNTYPKHTLSETVDFTVQVSIQACRQNEVRETSKPAQKTRLIGHAQPKNQRRTVGGTHDIQPLGSSSWYVSPPAPGLNSDSR